MQTATDLRASTFLLSFLFALASVTGSGAASPWAFESTGVETPDGEWLATDVYLPAASAGKKVATVLMRTPYGRHQFRDGEMLVAPLTRAGFAVVLQDVRGKWGSTGEFMPFVNEQRDGVATLDWIIAQPWSNGGVGMWGSSYPGFAALVLLPTAHPALATVFSVSGWLDGNAVNRPGGALHLMLALPWLLQQETERARSTLSYDLDRLFEHLPLVEAFESIGVESRAWRDPSILEPPAHDFQRTPPKASVFHLTGWYDFVAVSTLDVYRELAAGATRQQLHVGPWQHNQVFTDFTSVGDEDFGPDSVLALDGIHALTVRWFEAELAGGSKSALSGPAVRVFVMGADEWRDFDSWPPRRSIQQRWLLASDDGKRTLLRATNSSQMISQPVHEALPCRPTDPVPTWGGANFHLFGEVSGVLDQRRIEARDDVRTFTSAPLEAPILILGPVRARIHISTEGRDADLVAKLVVVRPDGYARLVTDGVVRASSIHGALTPGERVALEVDLGDTAVRVARGERLRVQLAGSNFPKFDRNPHSGVDPREATELLDVTHTVHSTPEAPSFLELTVLDDRAASTRPLTSGE